MADGKTMGKALLGALVGLARATDGNEFRVTADTDRALIEGLARSAGETSGGALEALLRKVQAEKHALIPDCALCAAPCGRREDYDLGELERAAPAVRACKERLLSLLQDLAGQALRAGAWDEPLLTFLYRALFAVGEDVGAEALFPLLQEAEGLRLTAPARTYEP